MLSNIKYRLSCFADYSNIYYNSEKVDKIISKFSDSILIPSILPEADSVGIVRNGILLTDQTKLFSIAIMGGRIDATLVAGNKEGFEPEKIDEIKHQLINSFNSVYDVFSESIQDAYRMAWYTEYVYFEIDDNHIISYKDKFAKPVDCIKGIETTEFSTKYSAIDLAEIDEKNEKYNLITNINRIQPGSGGFYDRVNGYMIGFDINTHQNSKKNRINMMNFEKYVDTAIEFQEKLKRGFIDELII